MATSKEEDFNSLAHAKFKPYVIAVGRVAHAWNQLQESLGNTFAEVVGTDDQVAFAIWYSAKADRAQHLMLKAAIAATADTRWSTHPKAKEDLVWLVDRTISLATSRNDAIHAPVAMIIANNALEIIPHYFNGNPSAESMLNKEMDIVQQLDWCASWSKSLQDFADETRAILRFDLRRPWPGRPAKPDLPPKRTRPNPPSHQPTTK